MQRTEVAAPLTESEPTFREIELIAHELSGHAYLSNALSADLGQGIEALRRRVFGSALVWLHEYAFLRGNGVGTFLLTDAAKMLSRLLPGWDSATTAWLVHPTVLEKLFQQADTAAGALPTAEVAGRPKLYLCHIRRELEELFPDEDDSRKSAFSALDSFKDKWHGQPMPKADPPAGRVHAVKRCPGGTTRWGGCSSRRQGD